MKPTARILSALLAAAMLLPSQALAAETAPEAAAAAVTAEAPQSGFAVTFAAEHVGVDVYYPFLADSITDFWRRWHISLGTWFRDYVYIPLGGNRGGLAKQLRNIAIVWLLTGFWHGASWNFVLWGVYFGVLLVLEKLFLLRWLRKLPAAFRHIYALALVTVSWTLFAFPDIARGFAWGKAMFSGKLYDSGSLYLLLTYGAMLALCALAATPLGKRCYEKLNSRLGQRALTAADCGGLVCVLGMAAAYLVSGSYNPFLYFRF